jgi:CBS domain containing-hemolysin-like protein
LLLGFVAQPVIADLLRPWLAAVGVAAGGANAGAVVLSLLLATVAQMLFGELVPQNLAISRPLPTALIITPVQRGFSRLFRPVIALCNDTANAVVRGLGAEPQEELRAARTPAELASLIGTSAEQGTLPGEVAGLLRRALTFGERTASDVMTPRVQVASLEAGHSAADLLDAARRLGHSRFPVQRGHLDEVVGVVHVKHAFAVPPDQRPGTTLAALMVEPVRVPDTLPCDRLLAALAGHGLQLAVVVDEYGGTAGVVTMEDLVEELVGQIRDEHDQFEEPDIIEFSDGSWSISGLLRRDELADRLGFTAPPGPYDTVAGLVLHRYRRLPEGGETVAVAGWSFTVVRMAGRRIDRIRVQARAGQGR